ncbi:MAG: hypothetical protein IJW97_06030 [Clostridia bacterium]|nr:hypothetical protein [Clostridia bacterium]
MRSFLITLLLFVLTLALLCVGTFFVNRVGEQALLRLHALEPSAPDPDALNALEQYWSARRPALRLVAARDEINAVSDALTALRAASAPTPDSALCRIWHGLAVSAVEELRRSQDLAWK